MKKKEFKDEIAHLSANVETNGVELRETTRSVSDSLMLVDNSVKIYPKSFGFFEKTVKEVLASLTAFQKANS